MKKKDSKKIKRVNKIANKMFKGKRCGQRGGRVVVADEGGYSEKTTVRFRRPKEKENRNDDKKWPQTTIDQTIKWRWESESRPVGLLSKRK